MEGNKRPQKVLPNDVLRAIKDFFAACAVPEDDEPFMDSLLLFLGISSPSPNIIRRGIQGRIQSKRAKIPDPAEWKKYIAENVPAIYPTGADWFVKFLESRKPKQKRPVGRPRTVAQEAEVIGHEEEEEAAEIVGDAMEGVEFTVTETENGPKEAGVIVNEEEEAVGIVLDAMKQRTVNVTENEEAAEIFQDAMEEGVEYTVTENGPKEAGVIVTENEEAVEIVSNAMKEGTMTENEEAVEIVSNAMKEGTVTENEEAVEIVSNAMEEGTMTENEEAVEIVSNAMEEGSENEETGDETDTASEMGDEEVESTVNETESGPKEAGVIENEKEDETPQLVGRTNQLSRFLKKYKFSPESHGPFLCLAIKQGMERDLQ